MATTEREAQTVADAIQLGNAIRVRRRDLGLNQTELATAARTSLRFVSEVERGKPTARLDGILRLIAALGLEFEVHRR